MPSDNSNTNNNTNRNFPPEDTLNVLMGLATRIDLMEEAWRSSVVYINPVTELAQASQATQDVEEEQGEHREQEEHGGQGARGQPNARHSPYIAELWGQPNARHSPYIAELRITIPNAEEEQIVIPITDEQYQQNGYNDPTIVTDPYIPNEHNEPTLVTEPHIPNEHNEPTLVTEPYTPNDHNERIRLLELQVEGPRRETFVPFRTLPNVNTQSNANNQSITEESNNMDITTSSLSSFNEIFFPQNSIEKSIEKAEEDIKLLRHQLFEKMKMLNSLKSSSSTSVISKNALFNFYNKHPGMHLLYDQNSNILTLKSDKTALNFHTKRGRNKYSCNDDIIYCTLPIYEYSLQFMPDGNVVGKVSGDHTTGHPHVVMQGGIFHQICAGNNRFITDYHNICCDNRGKDGNELMILMEMAAIWLESANLSDMYDTKLCDNKPIVIPTEYYKKEAIDKLFYYLWNSIAKYIKAQPLTALFGYASDENDEVYHNFYSFVNDNSEDLPDQLVNKLTIKDLRFSWRLLYALWMWVHFNTIIGGAYINKNSLYNAICMDIAVMLDLCDFNRLNFELNRESIITSCKAFKELCGYRFYSNDDTTVAEKFLEDVELVGID